MVFKILILLFSSVVMSQTTTKVDSSIYVAEFKGKKASDSWECFMSSSYSYTNTSRLNTSSSESSGQLIQEFSRRGQTYLTRPIKWDTAIEDNTFKVYFYAGGSKFHAQEEWDRKNCSYKTWEATTSHTETSIQSAGAVVLPKNVWLVRARFNKFVDSGRSEISLYNYDYLKLPSGEEVLTKKPLRKFESSPGVTYFIVNPSAKNIQNAIEIELNHVNKTVGADKFELELSFDLIGQTECMSNLGHRSYKDVLWESVVQDSASLDGSVTNLGCMLSPIYIKHVLKNLLLSDVTSFFKEVDLVEENLLSRIAPESAESQVVALDLLRKIRFYYSYEMAKDIVRLFQNHQSEGLTNLQAMEKLRFAGYSNLTEAALALKKILAILNERPEFVIELTKSEKVHFNVLVNGLIKTEMYFINKYHQLLTKPILLSSQFYDDLEKSITELNKVAETIYGTSLTLGSGRVTKPYLSSFQRDIQGYINAIENYSLAWQAFSGNFFRGTTGEEVVKSHREFFAEFHALFQLNGIGLASYFREHHEYFVRHFEAEELKDLSDQNIHSPEDFIELFHSLMEKKI